MIPFHRNERGKNVGVKIAANYESSDLTGPMYFVVERREKEGKDHSDRSVHVDGPVLAIRKWKGSRDRMYGPR